MSRSDILTRLKSAEPLLRRDGVAGLYLFGSHARDEATDLSDIDLFVDPADDDRLDFRAFMAAYRTLQGVFPGYTVDYGTRDGLSRHVRQAVEREAIRVF